jgi:hypothetical protein
MGVLERKVGVLEELRDAAVNGAKEIAVAARNAAHREARIAEQAGMVAAVVIAVVYKEGQQLV